MSDAFDRAYVATLFLLGARGEALAEAAGKGKTPSLLRALSNSDQKRRALALASEITRVALAVEKGAAF